MKLETTSAVLEDTSQAKNIAELAEDLELARRAQAFAGGFARLFPNEQELKNFPDLSAAASRT